MPTKRRFKKQQTWLKHLIALALFQKIYLFVSLGVLAVTTIFWSLIGALTHSGNADQLTNSYLQENSATFAGAILPDQHTFLLKLPLFWLTQALGGSVASYVFVTIITVLLTVGVFAFILHRIQPKPLMIGTIFFALALALMMIPSEPYANALLPTNMAMLTTRNLEYILFIGAVLLAVRAKSWRSPLLILSLIAMILLVASDKLFLSIGIGGAVIFLAIALFHRNTPLRQTAIRWLVVSVAGSVGALGLLRLLVSAHLIHLAGQSVAGPYGLLHSAKDFVFAVFYGIAGIFTNFGANPGYDSRTITDFAASAIPRIASPIAFAYIGTLAVVIGIFIIARRYSKTLAKRLVTAPSKKKPYAQSFSATIILITTSIAALGVYILSNHYYPVDSRYLTIFLFAGFFVLATFRFKKRLPTLRLVGVGVVLFLLLIPATFFVINNFTAHQTVSQTIRERNTTIAQALSYHPVKTLLGDYWRVLPIKSLASAGQEVTPLADCTTYRPTLTSTNWQPNLQTDSFAYLLDIGTSTPNFPACTLANITTAYGKPDSSIVISGTVKDPQELLLFYDGGIHKTPQTAINPDGPDTVVPVSLGALAYRSCPAQTIMSFAAHEDDDILFMNPDLYHDIQKGNCIRSVYLTAGDAGSADKNYWLGRQRGAEAAYASMLGTPGVTWTERVVEISPDHLATIANPRGNHGVSLIFLHLPDGNLLGQGFSRTHNESLAKLYSGRLPLLHTVDGSSAYSTSDVTDVLVQLLKAYQPNEIRSQSANAGTGRFIDHSDHTTVGHYVARAATTYEQSNPSLIPFIQYYLGYPIQALADNVTDGDLEMKGKTFLEFGRFDDATCHTIIICDQGATYGAYLRREYTSSF